MGRRHSFIIINVYIYIYKLLNLMFLLIFIYRAMCGYFLMCSIKIYKT